MRHFPTFWLAAGIAAVSAFDVLSTSSALASPQSDTATTAQPTGPYWAIVKGDNVMLRSAASVSSGYSMGKLFAGQAVKVVDVNSSWAKVQTVGAPFANVFGYVKSSSATQYDAATKKLTITGKTSLQAANNDLKMAPDKSWRELMPLAAGDTLQVIGEVKGQNDSYYSVHLPDTATAWVTLQYLEPAPQAQADEFERALQKTGATTPPIAPPTPTPTPTPNNKNDATGPKPATTTGDSAITNNPPTEETKPVVDTAAEDAARAAAARSAEAERIRNEQSASIATYTALEKSWARIKQEPEAAQELDALRQQYLNLADNGYAPGTTREQARARADQIELRIDVQNEMLKLAEMKRKMQQREKSIIDLELANLERRGFDAIGNLNASTVYNGDRLPLLYKLSDPMTGHTLAYVTPGPGTKPSEALGLLVGIKGKKQYDEALRTNVYVLEAFEPLKGSKATVVVPPETKNPPQ